MAQNLHILTLSWQGKDKLNALYPTLLAALDGINWKWHIKENGSTDGSVEEIKNWNDPNINLIAYPDNKNNYSEGINHLFKEANPKDDDIILTLNNDIIFNDTTSLHKMLNILKNDSGVGLVGAKLNYTNTNKLQHCGVLFHRSNGLPFHYRAGVVETERDKKNRYYPSVTGAVTMLRADTFANSFTNTSGNKGLNENYIFAFEDIDFCLRIKHHLKKQVVYCGETNIFHEESASLKKNPINKMFFGKNCKLFMETWHRYVDVSLVDKYDDPNFNLYKRVK